MRNEATDTNAFFPLWKKYRPALLKLMMEAMEGKPQEYQFAFHEFDDLNPKKTTNYPFKLEVHKGRAVNITKTSQLAQALLSLLNSSATAWELMEKATFKFELNKKYILHISAELVEEEVDEEEEGNEDDAELSEKENKAEE